VEVNKLGADLTKVFTGTMWGVKGAYCTVEEAKKDNTEVAIFKGAAAAGSTIGALSTLSALSNEIKDIDNKIIKDCHSAVVSLKTSNIAKSSIGQKAKDVGKFAAKHVNKFIFAGVIANIVGADDDKKIEAACEGLTGFGVMTAAESFMKTTKGQNLISKAIEYVPFGGKGKLAKSVLSAGLVVAGSTGGTISGKAIGEQAAYV
jgi:hypothetical protein